MTEHGVSPEPEDKVNSEATLIIPVYAGLAAALPLDDMIMNSIGQSGPPLNAPADSTLHQGEHASNLKPSACLAAICGMSSAQNAQC